MPLFRARKRGKSKRPSRAVKTSGHTIRVLFDTLDEVAAQALAAEARTLLHHGEHDLTVDLTEVIHISAEGAAVLLVLAGKTAGVGTLTLVGLSDGQPAKRLKTTGLFTLQHVVVD
ncbi:hypothetical protein [Yinghuangia sp. YIM S09857]|uniref:hypothetical protein n=1 Tax=Yinghuangia sp. YIM S09857 TaxID=3436929 RepID=UPI003F52AF1A